MSHPYGHLRQHHVESERAHKLTHGYARGGMAKHADEAEDRKMVHGMVKPAALKADGKKAKHRLDKRARGKVKHRADGGEAEEARDAGTRHLRDQAQRHAAERKAGLTGDNARQAHKTKNAAIGAGIGALAGSPTLAAGSPVGPIAGALYGAKEGWNADEHKRGGRVHRARGGKVSKKGTTVNIMIEGKGDGAQPMPVPVPAPAAAAPPMPMRPPMMPPPGAAPGGPPPGMPPMIGRKRGGAVKMKSGPAWEEGLKNGTPVEHAPGKNDGALIDHSRAALTRKHGGRASYPLSAGADSGPGRLQRTRAQKGFHAP